MKLSKAIQRLVDRAERVLTGRSSPAATRRRIEHTVARGMAKQAEFRVKYPRKSKARPKTLRGQVAQRQRQRVLPVPGLFGKWKSIGHQRTALYAHGYEGESIAKAVTEKTGPAHYIWDVCDEYDGCKGEGFARNRADAQAHAESLLLRLYAGKAVDARKVKRP